MKKVANIFFCIVLAMLLSACSPRAAIPVSSINVNIGDEFSVPIEYLSNRSWGIEMQSSDENVLTQTGRNTFTAINGEFTYVQLFQYGTFIDQCLIKIDIPVEEIKFEVTNITADVGEKVKIPYTVIPENATNQQIRFVSDNSECLFVEDNAIFLAKSEGISNVSIYNDDIMYDSCRVEVKNVPVENISFPEKEMTIYLNHEKEISVEVLPENATDKSIKLTTNNRDCLEYKEGNAPNKFILKGNAVGEAVLSATTPEGLKASVRVKVVPVPLEAISLHFGFQEIFLGKPAQISYTLIPSDVEDKAVTFKSSNDQVLRVDDDGNLMPVGIGTATITAIHTGSKISQTIDITVKPIDVTEIRVIKNNLFYTLMKLNN